MRDERSILELEGAASLRGVETDPLRFTLLLLLLLLKERFGVTVALSEREEPLLERILENSSLETLVRTPERSTEFLLLTFELLRFPSLRKLLPDLVPACKPLDRETSLVDSKALLFVTFSLRLVKDLPGLWRSSVFPLTPLYTLSARTKRRLSV